MRIVKVNDINVRSTVDKEYKNGYVATLFCYEENCYDIKIVRHDKRFNPYTGEDEPIMFNYPIWDAAEKINEIFGFDVEKVTMQIGSGFFATERIAYQKI